MKSLLIWLCGMMAGAGLGYASSYFFDVHTILLIAVGLIIGSSVSITINIHRDRDEIPDDEDNSSPESNS